jgi:hypothetical protein
MRFRSLAALAAVPFATFYTLAACQRGPATQQSYAISVSGTGNHVVSISQGTEALFEVTSDSGLGSADIRQVAGESPEAMVFRLHLRGLEGFSFEYDDRTVLVSVSGHGDGAVSESVTSKESGETIIGTESPYWMPVEVMDTSTAGDQEVSSYFVVGPSKDFLEGEYRAFSIRWIDFYR